MADRGEIFAQLGQNLMQAGSDWRRQRLAQQAQEALEQYRAQQIGIGQQTLQETKEARKALDEYRKSLDEPLFTATVEGHEIDITQRGLPAYLSYAASENDLSDVWREHQIKELVKEIKKRNLQDKATTDVTKVTTMPTGEQKVKLQQEVGTFTRAEGLSEIPKAAVEDIDYVDETLKTWETDYKDVTDPIVLSKLTAALSKEAKEEGLITLPMRLDSAKKVIEKEKRRLQMRKKDLPKPGVPELPSISFRGTRYTLPATNKLSDEEYTKKIAQYNSELQDIENNLSRIKELRQKTLKMSLVYRTTYQMRGGLYGQRLETPQD